MKPKNNLDKYLAINVNANSGKRSEQLDMDYLDELNEEQLDWLNRAMGEYITGSFPRDEITGKYKSDNFHKTASERKQCTDRNNARNRDLYLNLKLSNHFADVENIDDFAEEFNFEDVMIRCLDSKKESSKQPGYNMFRFIKRYFKLFRKSFVEKFYCRPNKAHNRKSKL